MQLLKRLFDSFKRETSRLKQRTLLIVLLVGLVQGLLYVFLIPPWWHNDEPGHFEFAWQIVHFDHWPQFEEFDEAMRRKVAASMLRSGYYDVINYQPDLASLTPVYIGVAPQTTNYPLYYLVASLPLRVLGKADFAVQDRAVRLMSLGMFLLALWAAWKALGELLPEGHPAQWMTVLFLTLLPGFTDTMTSISDDAGAALVFSIFVWVGLRILRRGLSFSRSMALIVSLALCYWTKSTTWPAFALAAIILLFAIFRGQRRWLAWTSIAVALIGGAWFSLRQDDAALWYRGNTQSQSTRIQDTSALLGDYAFNLHYQPGQSPWIGQFISASQIQPLRQKTVTLGAWMWASQPAGIQLPILRMKLYNKNDGPGLTSLYKSLDEFSRQMSSDSVQNSCSACVLEVKQSMTSASAAENAEELFFSPAQSVTLTTTPVFYSIVFDVPFEAENGWLELIPFPVSSAEGDGQNVTIYYDGLVLAEGEREGSPQFDTPSAQAGTWGGQPFHNFARNPSAESAWLRLTPQAERIMGKIFSQGNSSVFIASLQDWQGTSQYYRVSASSLFQTFWAATARGHVHPLGKQLVYEILQWITALGLIGAFAAILRSFRRLPWPMLVFLGMALIGIWGLTLARGGVELLIPNNVIPWVRYAFPAAIPTALLLCVGWRENLRWIGGWFKISSRQQARIFIAFLVGLDIFALLGIARYFYWKNGEEYFILFIVLLLAVWLGFNLLDKKSPPPLTHHS